MTRHLIIILLSLLLSIPSMDANSQRDRKATTTQTGKGSRKKATTKKGGNQKKSSKKRRSAENQKTESSADVKRRQQATQQEIKKTQAEIAANDKAVKTGLADLGRISSEINDTKKQVAAISSQVKGLDSKIDALQSQISAGENELSRMRVKYLEAVKKMRLKKGSQSTLAFIFSSKSFNQAMRRMRYLRQFSDWKDRQSHLITEKVKRLRYQTELLAQTKSDKDRALRSQLAAQRSLEHQHAEQDAVVAGLKKNGEALRSHLARKQAEANDLRNRVAALIAQEQAAAEARRREEERREQERIAEQERQERLLAEAEAKAEKEKPAEASNKDKKETKKDKKEKPKEKPKKEKQPKPEQPRKSSGSEYAEARKRRPRSDAKTASYSNFEASKGNLPRPVSGAFRVTSPFGRHALPNLPDVMYDNPGIDAQVADGASAQAVFAGRVSGVYMLPGYNTVVIVNHGNYYTIYGNIASASVKVGDSVKQGQALGSLATDPDTPGHSLIHFEVWKNREKLNPMSWIR